MSKKAAQVFKNVRPQAHSSSWDRSQLADIYAFGLRQTFFVSLSPVQMDMFVHACSQSDDDPFVDVIRFWAIVELGQFGDDALSRRALSLAMHMDLETLALALSVVVVMKVKKNVCGVGSVLCM